jgi:hypothetical protein
MEWADVSGAVSDGDGADQSPSSGGVPAEVGCYLDRCRPPAEGPGACRWHVEFDPEEVEYLVLAFFHLDARLSDEVRRGQRSHPPAEGRHFYLVLVRDLLHALEVDSPGRAAFADQLRSSWPTAAAAST